MNYWFSAITVALNHEAHPLLEQYHDELERVKKEYLKALWCLQEKGFPKANYELMRIFRKGGYTFPQDSSLANEFAFRPHSLDDMLYVYTQCKGCVDYQKAFDAVKKLPVQKVNIETEGNQVYPYVLKKTITNDTNADYHIRDLKTNKICVYDILIDLNELKKTRYER